MAEGRADTRGSEELVPLAPLSGTGLVLKSDAEQQFTTCRADNMTNSFHHSQRVTHHISAVQVYYLMM